MEPGRRAVKPHKREAAAPWGGAAGPRRVFLGGKCVVPLRTDDNKNKKSLFFSETTLVSEKEKIKPQHILKMPKSAQRLLTPVNLTIRLNDFNYETQARTFFAVGDMFDAVYGIKHTGKKSNNPHWHFVVESWYSKDTLRARIAKEFDLFKGNKNHSLKEWDGDDQLVQYTLHELKDFNDLHNVLMVNSRTGGFKMFAECQLKKLHTRSQSIVADIRENSPNKICLRIAQQILDGGFKNNTQEIFRLICKHLMLRGKFLPNKFQAERWVLQVQVHIAQIHDSKTEGEFSQERLIQQLYNDYFNLRL